MKRAATVPEVNGLVRFEVEDVDESPIDVFVEEPEILCPVVAKNGRMVVRCCGRMRDVKGEK